MTSQLQRARLWLLIIHCVNHRLELAIKDAFREDSSFTEASDVLLGVDMCTRNSEKIKALLKKIALDLDVMWVAFVTSDGTRFQNHKYRIITALIVNYFPMSLLMENYTAAGSKFADEQK